MNSDSEMNQNSPKRIKSLRKRKSIAASSTSRFNCSDFEMNSENYLYNKDFDSSGEYGDATWVATQSDYDDYVENIEEDSSLFIMEQNVSSAVNGGNTSGRQSQVETLCTATATTSHQSVESSTVSSVTVTDNINDVNFIVSNSTENVGASNITQNIDAVNAVNIEEPHKENTSNYTDRLFLKYHFVCFWRNQLIFNIIF